MLELIEEKVSMITVFNKDTGIVKPHKMRWGNRYIDITEVTYHHLIKEGKKIFHVFHVTDGNLDYRLHCNTENLHWQLIEVSDGNS